MSTGLQMSTLKAAALLLAIIILMGNASHCYADDKLLDDCKENLEPPALAACARIL